MVRRDSPDQKRITGNETKTKNGKRTTRKPPGFLVVLEASEQIRQRRRWLENIVIV
jgi:hypothetical protein